MDFKTLQYDEEEHFSEPHKKVKDPVSNTLNEDLRVPLPATLRQDKVLSADDMIKLEKQWQLMQNLSAVDLPNDISLRRLAGLPELASGTLVHGTSFTLEKMSGIAAKGVISGEFLGVVEDNETNYCADFYRVPQNMSVQEYLQWCGEFESLYFPIKRKRMEHVKLPYHQPSNPRGFLGSSVAIFFNTKNNEMDRLAQMDAYGNGQQNMQTIVTKLFDKPEERRRLAAILAGVPATFISGIVLPPAIINQEGLVEQVKALFDSKVEFFDIHGTQI